MCEFQKKSVKVGSTIEVVNAISCGGGYKNGDWLSVTRVASDGNVYATKGTCGDRSEHYLLNTEFKVVW